MRYTVTFRIDRLEYSGHHSPYAVNIWHGDDIGAAYVMARLCGGFVYDRKARAVIYYGATLTKRGLAQ